MHECVEVVVIIQVGVEGDDAQAERVDDRVTGIVKCGLLGRGIVNPPIVLP
jgi:hypothetical protein